MLKLSRSILPASVAGAVIGLSTLTTGVMTASAQDWRYSYAPRTDYRCTSDGRCATYRCDYDGDNCRRVSGWSYRGYRGYRGYRDYSYGYRTETRCTWDRCASYRCDADGDRCVRTSGFWVR